ncbi:MAG: glycosyltransferase family 4 protein [Candidatus Lokiarchaeota archaeon]|nr:glycosyltransferase family 4 protein [Candidatus Lokiarchaeota archaeon]
MKALYFTSSLPRYKGDFKGSFLVDQLKYLKEYGLELEIITPRSYYDRIYEINGFPIKRFPYLPRKLERITLRTIESSIRISPEWIFYLGAATKEILRKRPNIIHSHWILPFGFVSSLKKTIEPKIPFVITSHGQDINIPWKNPWYRGPLNIAFKKADKIIFVANHLKEKAIKLGLDEKKAELIHLGIDVNYFNPDRTFDKSNHLSQISKKIPSQVPVIGTLSSLIPRKNVQDLLKAVKRIHDQIDCYIIIGGEGEEKQVLEEFCQKNNLKNVYFPGKIRRADVPLFLSLFDVFVLSSEGEGLATALQEAMAMKNVPVVSDSTQCDELITHEKNGLIYRHNDIQSLEEQILKAINNKDIGEKARQTIKEDFNVEKTTKKLLRLYHSLQ